MRLWRRLIGDRPIVTRLVLVVTGAMAVVLLAAGAFVVWRVAYALSRQLDQDLDAYQRVVDRAVAHGAQPPSDTPGQRYQVYDAAGDVVAGNMHKRLADRQEVHDTLAGRTHRDDIGSFLPPAEVAYRFVTSRVRTPSGTVVVAASISRHKHDEALRELLLQLALADLVTLAAASIVGYCTARAALNPVESYRRAAAGADSALVLPVDRNKDDEITRLGHTFNALLQHLDEAHARERQFLADASHELRSPLALMRTELEVAALHPQTAAEQTDTYASLGTQVERLIGLSNALLELEELRGLDEPGRTRATADVVDVSELVTDAADRLRPEADRQGRRVRVAVDEQVLVTGNARWLDLAITNLAANALRHGEGTITLTGRHAPGTSDVQVTVSDEGHGFPPRLARVAFDRFTRGDESRSSPGTGLGLALVKAVAEAHRGDARIDGSSISLRLPVGAVDAARCAVRLR
ncbi:MAG: HAMP domain-containing histidine kinase [Nocardioidaceae bacterium]|nr:HAMP domain-containing histidine kinase [Nocardioidaceae bacterium]NUS52621.1 HAMP domain-containing histidine kinase [Nocardioidaceae bacterium]